METCAHTSVTVYVRVVACATRYEPAETVDDHIKCNDCREELDDVPHGAHVDVELADRPLHGAPSEFYD